MGTAFFVANKDITILNLWRTESNKFRVTQFGEFRILLTGSDYTLIHKDYLSVFELLLSDEIEFNSVEIERKSTGEIWKDYFEMKIKKYINPENFGNIDKSGEQVWQYQHNLFVSEELKNKLQKHSNGELIFTIYFSQFG